MPLDTKDFDTLHAMALGAIRASLPGANLSPGTDFDISARLAATMALMNQANAAWLARQLFPTKADADMIEEHGVVRGMSKLPATKMSGKVMLTAASGTSTQNVGSVLTAGDGRTYKTTSSVSAALPSWTGKTCAAGSTTRRLFVLPDVSSMAVDDLVTVSGEKMAIRSVLTAINAIDLYQPLSAAPAATTAITATRGAVAPVQADVAEAAGNQIEGDSFTLSSPASGIDSSAKLLVSGGGSDEETPGELAARVQASMIVGGYAGSATQIRAVLRAYEAQRVEDAVVIPGIRGLGTIDAFAIGPSGGRVLDLSDGLMLAALKATMPEQIDISLRSLEYDTFVDVDLRYESGPGFQPDWSPGFGLAGTLTLTGTSHTTTRIFVSENPSLQGCLPGKRIVLPVKYGTVFRTESRVVQAVGFSTNWYVDVTVPLPSAPVTVEVGVLFSGGPTTEAVLDAVYRVFDRLGPSAIKNTSPTAFYHRVPGDDESWFSVLYPGDLVAEVSGVEGVVTAAVSAPVSPTYPGLGKTVALGKLFLSHT